MEREKAFPTFFLGSLRKVTVEVHEETLALGGWDGEV